jgi:hypothetical protein
MILLQLIVLWIVLAIAAEFMAWQIKSYRENFWITLHWHAIYCLASPVFFAFMCFELKDEIKARKRQPEVIKILNSIAGYKSNCMLWPDRNFIIQLNSAPERGKLTDIEYQILLNLIEGYKLQNQLNVK